MTSSLPTRGPTMLSISLVLFTIFLTTASSARGQGQPGQRPGFTSTAIRLAYAEPGREHAESRRMLRTSGTFEKAVERLNRILSIPARIDVVFQPCREPNAYYDPERRKIAMCYELIEEYSAISSSRSGIGRKEVEENVINAAVFTFLPELGHALVHLLRLPIRGREEDAVDELAALIALAMGRDGEGIVFSALDHFAGMAETAGGSGREPLFWEEHSLDAERAGNIACIIYGSNPERYSALAGIGGLSPARARRCGDEFERRSERWEELLSGHLAG